MAKTPQRLVLITTRIDRLLAVARTCSVKGCCHVEQTGLLMGPEHSETKPKTETRECKTKTETETETKSCYESETKNYETETETSMINSVACEGKTNRYALSLVTYLK